MTVNCTYDKPPNITTLFKEISEVHVVLFSVATVLIAVTLVYYVIESVLFIRSRRYASYRYLQHIIFIQGTYPLYALMSYLSLISPQSMQLLEFVFALYFTFTLKELFLVMRNIIEKEESSRDENDSEVEPETVSLAAPPLACCFFLCCPRVSMGRKFERMICIGVHQAIILRPILIFIQAMFWTNGLFGFDSENAGILVLEVINSMCVLVSMYFMVMQYRGNIKILKPHYMRVKLVCIPVIMIVVTLQSAIMRELASRGVISCSHPFNAYVNASALHHFLALIEMPLILLFSSTICQKPRYTVPNEDETKPLLNHEPTFG